MSTAFGRPSRAEPHPMLAEMVLRAPRPPEPTFADLPELMAMPMLLGIGFWVPGAGGRASGGEETGVGEGNNVSEGGGVGAEGRVSSPAPRDEGRPLPGIASAT
ncbi:hypothetical protein [Streptomyces sp. NPDC050255]|uniref:hypothetical protein n=1 Tax=Streptomyces sp. NPDC050255 TaxID=3365606 RepID=UPI0037929061